MPHALPNNQKIFVSLVSGAVAGAVAKTVIAPLDRTKIYFQTHPEKRYRLKGAWKFIRLTYNNTGILRYGPIEIIFTISWRIKINIVAYLSN